MSLALVDLVVGILYPAYHTLSLLQNQTDVHAIGYKAFTLYWVLFAALQSFAWLVPGWTWFAVSKTVLLCVLQIPGVLPAFYWHVHHRWYPLYVRLKTD